MIVADRGPLGSHTPAMTASEVMLTNVPSAWKTSVPGSGADFHTPMIGCVAISAAGLESWATATEGISPSKTVASARVPILGAILTIT